MTGWAVRGIGMALVNVIARVLLGSAVAQWPLSGSSLRWVAYALVLLIIIVWAGIDGIRDRRANPDPDKGADLTMIWLKAAVLGGLLAGLLSWIVGFFVDFSLGQNSLFFELTSGAAFTILTIFITASIAVFVGHFIVNREAKKKLDAAAEERTAQRARTHAGGVDERGGDQQWTAEHDDSVSRSQREADTEVFAAVDADGNPRADNRPRMNKHGSADGS